MSGRSGAALGPQPLKATQPYQLVSKPRPHWRDEKSARKTKPHPLSSGMRRTMSLDAIVGPYLNGHWPKEAEGQIGVPCNDKSTQTPYSWLEKCHGRRGSNGTHKRSASWGSADHLREIAKLKQLQQCSKPSASGGHDKGLQHSYPQGHRSLGVTQTQPIPIPLKPLSTLAPPLRCSVEGLNQELERMFISHSPYQQQRLHEIPDGHRAPVPQQSRSSGSQSDPAATPPSPSSSTSSPCSSPNCICTAQPNSADTQPDQHQGSTDGTGVSLLSSLSQNDADPSLAWLNSSSPGPNKSCCFQRKPPEGCEKVRVWEETSTPHKLKPALVSSCPDPNKVNFTLHGGSAFCPVNLPEPLLSSMGRLYRSLQGSTAGTCSNQGMSSCHPKPFNF
ncbi:protein FAM117A-like isoform 2-T2 [Pholidichthys leucotaenia]